MVAKTTESMTEITITKPDDFHAHLRQGELMKQLVKETAKSFARVLVMPNTLPPITTPESLIDYRHDLEKIGTDLQFLMTFKIIASTLPRMIPDLKKAGAMAGKFYPAGVTTHSEDGITDIAAAFPVFAAMQESELVLSIHGEMPDSDSKTAERDFLPWLMKIQQNFPRLRIVLEHVSSKEGIEAVKSLPSTVAATLTVHHALLNEEKIRNPDGSINPYLYCKPIVKTEDDRKAIMAAMVSGNPRFFLGTDSAPHLKEKKSGPNPAAGIYSLPVALLLLAEIFEKNNCLDRLEAFTSHFGADFYQLPRNTKKITLKKEIWMVPDEQFGVVLFMAGDKRWWNLLDKIS